MEKISEIEKVIDFEKKLSEYDGEDKIISSHEMQEICLSNKKRKLEFTTGFPKLDRILGGFNAGELNTISGITGEGKTLLCQTITNNLITKNISCCWFSYEVMPEYFLKSFGEPLPEFYMPKQLKLNSLKWLEMRIYEAHLKYDAQVIFIDHLHYL